jgi:hypothetical protein
MENILIKRFRGQFGTWRVYQVELGCFFVTDQNLKNARGGFDFSSTQKEQAIAAAKNAAETGGIGSN